ncbi:alkaline phosphatase [Glycocaulis alkaliphilus]|nr:alkaline phosphatase [Glycocaulis alkaliphilus]GGB71648.1 alkaline phosphatase [Glycocaulis alkaliphilus]
MTRFLRFTAISFVALGLASAAHAQEARNVILMISDGAGMTTWQAASHYRHGELGGEVYDGFDVHVFMSTYSQGREGREAGSYEAAPAWDGTPAGDVFETRGGSYPQGFEGYRYLRTNPTDSAAAGTALASGVKVHNGALNIAPDGTRLAHIGQTLAANGGVFGSISDVYWSHATPAAFLAHNISRQNYEEIARQIVTDRAATVVMGAGHPYFDDNGLPRSGEDVDYSYVGGADTWQALSAGEAGWTLIDTLEGFAALASGEQEAAAGDRIIGTVPVAATIRFGRDGEGMNDPLIPAVPDLATMSTGALNVLNAQDAPFFLMIEGGAVDWAAHSNNLPRIIEEQVAFNLAVEAVVDWVETHSSWEETLIVITTDHGNGLLLGPDSLDEAFQNVIGQGAGMLPLARWHTDNHTNELVPLWAHGAGADRIRAKATQRDDGLAAWGITPENRIYLDNTALNRAMHDAMGLEFAN